MPDNSLFVTLSKNVTIIKLTIKIIDTKNLKKSIIKYEWTIIFISM